LKGDDYIQMGTAIGMGLGRVPIVFLQEGGYKMDTVADAAASVVLSCSQARSRAPV